ncbi:ribosome biogenesis GTP-binding protein YihA/YsxC [Pelagibaculum spongiae]|uniref:Probable GTP-binding protein EngB n=1 Tax=Pelagibaculum spongiae TaxID=2080658 RepID=A0A2V1GW12_9GAMM|nr:ribosome biogenesis GTP-binding protein YihA/YsxC [Pelagibaculum spongiae]PVZ70518.1 YihA family ribosome biogenesis GTP-binding protein [Pelagibaculum spongiae]
MSQQPTNPANGNWYHGASYLISAAELSQLPEDTGFEVAFAGRSNAGKSSAINTICNQKSLCRTSKTPGRTQLINQFELDDTHRLTDLPGYGYAKVPEAMKRRWQKTLGEYLETRKCLQGVVLMMDIRHPMSSHDLQMLEWARACNMPVHCLLTKADKLKRGPAKSTLLQVLKELKKMSPLFTAQMFSSSKRDGLPEAWQKLNEWYQVNQD